MNEIQEKFRPQIALCNNKKCPVLFVLDCAESMAENSNINSIKRKINPNGYRTVKSLSNQLHNKFRGKLQNANIRNKKFMNRIFTRIKSKIFSRRYNFVTLIYVKRKK